MTPQEQQQKLSQNIVDSLCHISERPDGWLPRITTDEDEEAEYEVERLTLDELAERINDECFNDTEDYVRFIQMTD